MGIVRLAIEGNSYVGAFGIATDKFAMVGNVVGQRKESEIKETLGVDVIRASVDSSYLIGLYVIANSNGVLLPEIANDSEVGAVRRSLQGVNVGTIDTGLNALRNNILANDRIAILNPEYSQKEERIIGEVLGVETMRRSIAGFNTVGANSILTNKGIVLNNRITEEERSEVEELVGMKSDQSTANLGFLNVGLCAIANSNGLVIGEQTTGYEMVRISNALNLD